LIYEHIGSERDRLDYPQTELITSNNRFTYRKDNIAKLLDVRLEIYSIKPFTYPFMNRPTYQKIDSYGKVRYLFFDKIYLISDSLPPLGNVKLLSDFQQNDYNRIEDILQFIQTESISDISSITYNSKTIGLQFKKNNILFFIPIDQLLDDLNVSSSNQIVDLLWLMHLSKRKHLQNYQTFDKIARILNEYTYFLYSFDYLKYNQIDIDQELINRLFIVDENYIYNSHVSDRFSLELDFIRDLHLVVPSEDIQKRLIYNLKLKIKYDFDNLINYHKNIYLENYYSRHFDFKEHSHSILFSKKHQISNYNYFLNN
jgi:hypothetical protein